MKKTIDLTNLNDLTLKNLPMIPKINRRFVSGVMFDREEGNSNVVMTDGKCLLCTKMTDKEKEFYKETSLMNVSQYVSTGIDKDGRFPSYSRVMLDKTAVEAKALNFTVKQLIKKTETFIKNYKKEITDSVYKYMSEDERYKVIKENNRNAWEVQTKKYTNRMIKAIITEDNNTKIVIKHFTFPETQEISFNDIDLQKSEVDIKTGNTTKNENPGINIKLFLNVLKTLQNIRGEDTVLTEYRIVEDMVQISNDTTDLLFMFAR